MKESRIKYKVFIQRSAVHSIKNIGKQDVGLIKQAIQQLSDNPRPFGVIKLKGEEAYRIRVGKYRIIYEINDNELIIYIVAVAHKKDVYKKRN